MMNQFTPYYTSIGLTSAAIERVTAIYDFYAKSLSLEVIDTFVSEYVNGDGVRTYESLWFFSSKYCMEAKQFLSQDDFDATPLECVSYWEIQKQDYDFVQATEKSRITLTFGTPLEIGGNLKASGVNCDHLKSVMLKYIVARTHYP